MIGNHKVYDCITFFNEIDLLKLRLNILDNVVDYFVICESEYDHRGKKKKIFYNESDFAKFKKKIIFLNLKKFPSFTTTWERQDFQRNFLINGLKNAKNDDIILFSDVDEIPNLENNEKIILNNLDKIGIFNQKVYYYKLNLRVEDYKKWEGTRILRKKNLKSFSWLRANIRLKNLRYKFWRIDKFKNIYEILDGGWHFSFLGDVETISSKIKSYTHSEFDKKKFTDLDKINERIINMKDPYDRQKKLIKTLIDSSYPEYIFKNQHNLTKLILS